ncbi:flagellar filament capping protein FliD [Sandaracinobacter neustonicus]|uniref:flagellar filament capping protein FliD n=1 Tax=Sandaracinobacter neustonicus TaxID=1715348 RepID=UPI0015E356B0|nr:flagellar filament capping protein FliD [Sandaracinobacter neustonicus]
MAKALAAAAVSTGMSSVIQSLNAGSGIDVQALTTSLVAAEKEPRTKLLDERQARVDARISALGQFRTGLDGVVSALESRISSGVLSAIASVSDVSVLGLSFSAGAVLPAQQIEVWSLAQGQTLSSAAVADAGAAVGQGTLTFSFGSVGGSGAATGFTAGTLSDLVVTIGPEDDSLTGLRDAINDAAASAGVAIEARILTDSSGSRLQIRGATGEAQGFTIAAEGDAALSAYAFGAGVESSLSRTQAASDALLVVDGLELKRSSNTVSDLLPGATLTLKKASPGTLVTIEAQRDTSELSQAVRDVAETLNQLVSFGRELSAGAGSSAATAGALVSDSTTRRVVQMLGSLSTRPLLEADGTAPTMLADLGITVDRTGSYSVDETRLAKIVATQPQAVEKLIVALNAPATTTSGVTTAAGPLRQMAALFKLAVDGEAGQPTALATEAAAIARDRTALDERMERLTDSYTLQFTKLDLAVGQSKQLLTYLQQQIALWTKSDS